MNTAKYSSFSDVYSCMVNMELGWFLNKSNKPNAEHKFKRKWALDRLAYQTDTHVRTFLLTIIDSRNAAHTYACIERKLKALVIQEELTLCNMTSSEEVYAKFKENLPYLQKFPLTSVKAVTEAAYLHGVLIDSEDDYNEVTSMFKHLGLSVTVEPYQTDPLLRLKNVV